MLPDIESTRTEVDGEDTVYRLFVEKVHANGLGYVSKHAETGSELERQKDLNIHVRCGHEAVLFGSDIPTYEQRERSSQGLPF